MKLVLFPFHDWRKTQAEGARTRDAHLIEAFLADPGVESVLIVDRPSTPLEAAIGRPRWVRGEPVADIRVKSTRGVLTRIADHAIVLDIATRATFALAVRRRGWWFDAFARHDVLELIDWAVETTDSHGAGLIAWVPTVAPAITRLLGASATGLVYDSLDNWLIHPVLRRHEKQAVAGYAEILPQADHVFASAPASQAILQRWARSATVLPNGVDPDRFAGTFDRPGDMPDQGLVVGYAGKLAERIDTDLIGECATLMPGATFVFIGPTLDRRVARTLKSWSNVRLLGDKPYLDLPAYLTHFDIAWIPHRVGDGETGGDPIKLYEYWAAGRPIISTGIDGVQTWRDRIRIIQDGAEVKRTIDSMGSPPFQADRAVPAERTWHSIAERLLAGLPGAPKDGIQA